MYLRKKKLKAMRLSCNVTEEPTSIHTGIFYITFFFKTVKTMSTTSEKKKKKPD